MPIPKSTTPAPARSQAVASPAQAAKVRAAAPPVKRGEQKASPGPADEKAPAGAVTKKQKLVRDSFSIPKSEYALLAELKQRALQFARPVKKSEVLRAGISALGKMSDKALLSALDAVPSLKRGRPKIDATPADKAARKKP